MGRHTGRRRDVSTIITASVTWFASFVTRSNWSHIEDRFNVSSSAPEISDDCGDNLPFQTALNSAKSNEINLLNQRFTFSENYPQWSPAAAKVFFHSSISCGKESSSSSILIQLRFFGWCMLIPFSLTLTDTVSWDVPVMDPIHFQAVFQRLRVFLLTADVVHPHSTQIPLAWQSDLMAVRSLLNFLFLTSSSVFLLSSKSSCSAVELF